MKKQLKILILVLISIIACSKDEGIPEEVLLDGKELTSLAFGKDKNNILVDSEGSIRNGSAKIFLPSGTDITQLKPDFQLSQGAQASINGEVITSGVSEVDFTGGVNFLVTAQDGSTKTYRIVVQTEIESLDRKVESILSQYNVPGLQLAIVNKGRLVYQKSYGYADREQNIKVTNNSLFRIASISKSFTLAAVLKLIEDNKLAMGDKIFGDDGILKFDYGTAPYKNYVEDITLKHLLEHKAGWVNYPSDAMFTYQGLSKKELLSEVLDNRSVVNEPGTVESYSNFGYFVLGRVIEKVTGKTYENYVKEAILSPCGITTASVGKKEKADKYDNEVTYYDQENYSPYYIDVSRMDAPGGWVTSAEDLVKYLVRVDRSNTKTDILSASSLNYQYLSYGSWVFNGSMAGTGSSLCRINDDFGGAAIVNSRVIPDTQMLSDINNLLTQSVPLISDWPSYDLFER